MEIVHQSNVTAVIKIYRKPINNGYTLSYSCNVLTGVKCSMAVWKEKIMGEKGGWKAAIEDILQVLNIAGYSLAKVEERRQK